MAGDQVSHVDQGFLRALFSSEADPTKALEPVLQCVQTKQLGGQQGAPERYRIILSDVQNYIQTMLATQANHVVHDGQLRRGCFVRLKKYNANVIKGKPILILLELEVLEELGDCEKLGDPKPLEPKVEGETQPMTISSNGFYGTKPEQKYHPEPSEQRLPSRTTAQNSSSHVNIYRIEAINPWGNKWTIKARVTSKSDIKTWHNKNGEGKLFSVNLLDDSGEIKATAFNDQCDAFFDLFTEGNVYYISTPCSVRPAKRQFSNVNNDYELSFERGTIVEKVILMNESLKTDTDSNDQAEEQSDVPQMRFNFTTIGNLQSIEKDAVIDTIGILKEVAETSEIISKTTQKPYYKRELTLVDNTNFSVRLTIWGNAASSFEVPLESVVAFKGVKVSDFGGRSLSLLSSGTMSIDPDIDEAHMLKGWYEAQGRNDNFTSHASVGGSMGATSGRQEATKTIIRVKDENLGMTDTADYFAIKATIIYVRQENVAYPACLSDGCNKKVIQNDNGAWRCEKCDKSHDRPEWRYIMTVNVADHTGQIYLSCFDDVGRMIMGMTANQLIELKEAGNDKDTFQGATYQTFNFRCRAKMDTYQDQQRVRYQVTGATPLNFVAESAKLASLIKMYD